MPTFAMSAGVVTIPHRPIVSFPLRFLKVRDASFTIWGNFKE